MLIDETYFTNHLKIVNIEEPDPNNVVRGDLLATIEECEEEILSFCMGVRMWLDFKEQYLKNPASLPQNYKDILHGKTYTKKINGKEQTLFWQGLVDEKNKKSLLAYYTYIVYQWENVYLTTAFGQTKIEGKVGEIVSTTPKITKVYNEFIRLLQGGVYHTHNGLTIEGRPFWIVNGGLDYYGMNEQSHFVSFIQFLMDNKEDFPLLESGFKYRLNLKNEFGI